MKQLRKYHLGATEIQDIKIFYWISDVIEKVDSKLIDY